MFKKYTYIILFNALLLPAVLFAIFEFSALSSNEKVIQQVYDNQLETIVFSVNQYSDDIISSWAEKINYFLTEYNNPADTLRKYLKSKVQLSNVFLWKNNKVLSLDKNIQPPKIVYIERLIKINDKQIRKNKSYLNVNYRKNEPLGTDEAQKKLYLAFWSGVNPESAQLCVMEIDISKFVKEVIAVRLQVSVEKEFYVAVFNRAANNDLVYFSEYNKTPPAFNFRKNLWLFPNYDIAVQIKKNTIEDVVKSRLLLNISLFAFIELLFVLVAVLIFRFTRKEMKLAKLKSEFISNVSHEIRTPLALINMYIETQDMGRIKPEEKVKEYYQVILQETQRLSGIVNNILNFSKLESGKTTFNFEINPVNCLVDEVLSTYNFHLKNKGFVLKTELAEDILKVKVDKRSICDVLVNLLDNAVKYSAEVKEITIRTGVKSGWVYIEVADKGIGISKENQRFIFDQFYRVTQGNLAHHAKGTGLGLSIVKYVVEAHNGKIEVDSTEGKGSIFRVLLPIKYDV